MRRWLVFFILFSLLCTANGQNFKHAEIKINTVSNSAIFFIFSYDTKLDGSKSMRAFKNSKNSFKLIDAENEDELYSGNYKNMGFQDSSLTLELVIKNPKLLDKVFAKQKPVYLLVYNDFTLYDANGVDSSFASQDFIKRETLRLATFSDRQLDLLGGVLDSNYIATKSRFDFAKDISSEDSSKSEYSVRFNLAGKMFRLFDVPFYFKLIGRVSTVTLNPLNQVESYIAMGVTQNLSFDAGIVSNQTLKKYAWRANLNFETLLPNFINLTFGQNRLRLKPYLNLGVSLHKNVQDNPVFENKDPKLLIVGSFYYPVPIGKKYSFIYNCDATWSDSFVKDKLIFNYQASLVYDTPLEDLKVLLKAESGKKLFINKKDTKLLLGMLLDITNI